MYSTVSESLGGSVCLQTCVVTVKRLWHGAEIKTDNGANNWTTGRDGQGENILPPLWVILFQRPAHLQ